MSSGTAAILRTATALLLAAALVLVIVLLVQVKGGRVDRRAAGDRVPLSTEVYGAEQTFATPASEMTVRVGQPVETLDLGLLDIDYGDPGYDDEGVLAPPDGGVLVPVSWRTVSTGGFLTEDDDAQPVELALDAGGERVALESVTLGGTSAQSDALDGRTEAVVLGADADVDELAVEVTYDGVTQRLDVASGELDAGRAAPLYEPDRDYTGGCVDVADQCLLEAADPDSPWRPDRSTFTSSWVSLYPYSAARGWAEEGTLWASVDLHLFGTTGLEDVDGTYRIVGTNGEPVVTLDGAASVASGLDASAYDTYGTVTFLVDADADPRRLVVEQVLETRDGEPPGSVPVRAVLDLEPVG